ncbi:putative g-protein coupled receptor 21 [Gigaspora margarita]|uniref:Putative g-protein coupled receptor 21 n=1 Tax=Gigaspora margarita TaxID=4874 RepID=A0A8H3WW94_GIGMA|nr:putative g-protein coupled receptor 21 [Gigaspora margarita]
MKTINLPRALLPTETVPIATPPSLDDARVPGSNLVIPIGMGILFLSGLCTLYVIFRTMTRWKTTQRSLPMALRVPFYIAMSDFFLFCIHVLNLGFPLFQGRPWPDGDCQLIGGITFFLVSCNMLLVGSLAMLTFLRICRRLCIDLGRCDYKLFAFVISLSFVLTMVGIPSFGASKYWCFTNQINHIIPYTTLALNFSILVIIVFCYAMTLREINSIQFRKDHKCKFDTGTKHKKIEPIVVRKIIGYVLIFVIQWTPAMIYVFCQTIGYDQMWIYLVTEATVNLGGIGNMIQYIINEGWRNDPDANINDSGDMSVIIPTPSCPDTNYPNYQISSDAPTITLPFQQSKIRVNEMITIKIDDYKSNSFIPDTFGDSPTIAPSIDSKVESLKNQRRDELIMKQQREIVQRDISVSSSSSQSDHSNIMNELDKIIERHNEDIIRHGGIMARQSDNMSRQSGTTTTLTREKSLKSYRKSIKNKTNRNDTVSWHRFGSGGNNRTSIRGLLQKVENFRKVKDPKNTDEIKEIDENLPPGGNDDDDDSTYTFL